MRQEAPGGRAQTRQNKVIGLENIEFGIALSSSYGVSASDRSGPGAATMAFADHQISRIRGGAVNNQPGTPFCGEKSLCDWLPCFTNGRLVPYSDFTQSWWDGLWLLGATAAKSSLALDRMRTPWLSSPIGVIAPSVSQNQALRTSGAQAGSLDWVK
ncbi:hypothetical protein VTK56DRAFT_7055 [Thermocarpiscus australiensis]